MPNDKLKQVLGLLNDKTKTLVCLTALLHYTILTYPQRDQKLRQKHCCHNTFSFRREFEIPRGRGRNEHFVSDASRIMQRGKYRLPPATPCCGVRGQGSLGRHRIKGASETQA